MKKLDKKPFTRRERQVYDLLLSGKSNKEIEVGLGVSSSTVKFHIANIFDKSKVRSRTELLAWAYRQEVMQATRPVEMGREQVISGS